MTSTQATKGNIVIVDDDESQRELLSGFLRARGYVVTTASSGDETLSVLAADDQIGLLISDVRMPGMNGIELLRRVREQHGDLPVLLVTGFADVRDAVEAMRDGALNYLEKPIDLDELGAMVADVMGGTVSVPASDAPEVELPPGVVAVSSPMRHVLRETALVAPFDSRVLITGESGTGKEVIAQLIHQWSARRDRPMIRVNCAAIPELLLESELFGHERGAFTGAVENRIGRFEEADGGTIFFDEIAEMPPPLQAKLLRVTQDGSFQRLGANRERKVDVRLLAATNRDLDEEVAAGRFREDLFYRLNVIEIHLPPLRERPADILPLANYFAGRHSGGHHRLSPGVAAKLAVYQWPGNVRELQNAMERAVLMARGGVILPEHLPRRLNDAVAGTEVPVESTGKLQEVENLVILQTLQANQYNRTETAKALGISRRALIYKLHRLEEEGHAIHP